MSRFVVHGVGMSTCTRRVLTAIEEKGSTYELRPVNFQVAEHKSHEYVDKHQPFGQVPVLYDGDFRVFESRAICRYVDDVIEGGIELVPKDKKKRALVEQWISVEMSHYKPAETLVAELLFKKFRGQEADQTVVEENKRKLDGFLVILNKELEGKNYLVGEQFSLADLVFLPYTDYLLKQEGFHNYFDAYPNVKRWWHNISTRPSWVKVSQLH